MAVLALYAIGAAAGGALATAGVVGASFLGVSAAAWGGAIASAVGGALLTPKQTAQGPRLSDLRAPQVAYGSVIPYVEGHPRLPGALAWQSKLRELQTTTEQGGKGGGGAEVTTSAYECDVLYILSENECGALQKVFKNGELVWTAGDDSDSESIEASGASELWDELIFYSGEPTQMPDPTYEAAMGVGNAPAYRTRASVMLRGVKLGGAGQLPVFTFVIVQGADPVAPNPPRFYAPLSADTQDTIATLATVTETNVDTASVTYASGWATFAGYTADPRVEYTGDKLDATGLRTYTIGIDSPSYSSDGGYQYVWEATDGAGHGVKIGFHTQSLGAIQYRFVGVGAGSGTWYDGVTAAAAAWWANANAAGYYNDGPNTNPSLCAEHWNPSGGTGNLDYYYTLVMVTGVWHLKVWRRLTGTCWLGPYAAEGPAETDDTVQIGFDETVQTQAGTPSTSLTLAVWIDGVDYDLGTSFTGPKTFTVTVGDGDAGAVKIYSDDDLIKSGVTTGTSLGTIALQGFGAGGSSGLTSINLRQAGMRTGIATAVQAVEPTLQEVVERQCVRAGLDLAYVDASALADQTVAAMALTQLSSPRQAIELLMAAYLFTCVESDVLRFTPRGGATIASIAYDELVSRDGAEALPIRKLNDIEQPVQVFVKYINVLDDYQDGSESSDRLTSDGENTVQVEIPLGLTPQQAKRVADVHALDAAAAALQVGPFTTTRDYAKLEPSDPITVEDARGNTFRVRMVKKSEAAGELTFDAVSDDASIINSTALTSTAGYTNSTSIRLPVDTDAALLDIPILQDADDNAGFYVACKPAIGTSFPGAVLFKSTDGVSYASVQSVDSTAVIGTATTRLGYGPTGAFDEMNAVTVSIGEGQASSVTRDALLNSAVNVWLIGDEMIQARDATLVSAGVYTLTGLLRGLKGTEWARDAHVVDERVVLVDSNLRRVSMATAEIGVEKSWKAVTKGRGGGTATPQDFTDHAVGLKPYAPADLRFARDASGNITVTLQRRTRMGTRMIGALGVSCPLGEESERYEVDIYADATYATVKRTLSATSASLAYSSANQVTDFGGNQATVYAKAYQLSATVGRGYPATAQG